MHEFTTGETRTLLERKKGALSFDAFETANGQVLLVAIADDYVSVFDVRTGKIAHGKNLELTNFPYFATIERRHWTVRLFENDGKTKVAIGFSGSGMVREAQSVHDRYFKRFGQEV